MKLKIIGNLYVSAMVRVLDKGVIDVKKKILNVEFFIKKYFKKEQKVKLKRLILVIVLLTLALMLLSSFVFCAPPIVSLDDEGIGCTTVICGKDATVDGSLITSHTADCGRCDPRIAYVPAMDHKPEAMRAVYAFTLLYPRLCCYDRGPTYLPKAGEVAVEPIGSIPEVEHTYAYYDYVYGIMNEHQLSMGESSCGAKTSGKPRPEGDALFDIAELSRVAMERCTTAREAIKLMGELGVKYGYYGGGEALTIIDTEEAWVFDMIETPDSKSAIWVAQRVPDDEVAVVANQFTIREIDLDNPDYFMASSNIFDIAKAEGWWNPAEGPFDFTRAYIPVYKATRYYSLRRKWRVFDLLAPSKKFSPWVEDSYTKAYPFSIKPDKKVSLQDIMAITRDYYQGTEFDLSKGTAAGPFGTPNRYGGAGAEKLIEGGTWERAIGIFRADYVWISQTRGWLPDAIGGVMWYTPDVATTSCYVPFYAGCTQLPEPYSTGSRYEYDENSAWWVFNFVSNWADLKFSYMIKDIKEKQEKIESKIFAFQPAVESGAKELYDKDPELARAYLTEYCVNNGNAVVDEWREFGKFLVAKYIDGYVNKPNVGESVGYPLEWLKEVGFGPIDKPNK